MTTDEMILALVERHGFVLPDGLSHGFAKDGGPDWWLTMLGRSYPASPKQAHDLCACEFARQVKIKDTRMGWHYHDIWMDAMLDGNSAAAIEALYEATESK